MLTFFVLFVFNFACLAAQRAKNKSPTIKWIEGVTNKILVVNDHKFYLNRKNKSGKLWVCRLRKSLG